MSTERVMEPISTISVSPNFRPNFSTKKRSVLNPTSNDLMTGEELSELGDIGRVELIQGKLIRMSPTGFLHGAVESAVGMQLHKFIDEHQLGHILVGEVGLYTKRNPDTVRGMDAAFISHQRMKQVQSRSYLDVAPELIVEVMSPDDRWNQVNTKIDEYFAVGALTVWIVDPSHGYVYAYTSPTSFDRFGIDDILDGGVVLPGFQVAVSDLLVHFEED